jgi:hypothetical protein
MLAAEIGLPVPTPQCHSPRTKVVILREGGGSMRRNCQVVSCRLVDFRLRRDDGRIQKLAGLYQHQTVILPLVGRI